MSTYLHIYILMYGGIQHKNSKTSPDYKFELEPHRGGYPSR